MYTTLTLPLYTKMGTEGLPNYRAQRKLNKEALTWIGGIEGWQRFPVEYTGTARCTS